MSSFTLALVGPFILVVMVVPSYFLYKSLLRIAKLAEFLASVAVATKAADSDPYSRQTLVRAGGEAMVRNASVAVHVPTNDPEPEPAEADPDFDSMMTNEDGFEAPGP